MNDMSLLRDYLKSQILKLEGTKVQEVKQKSEILVQHFLSISKSELYLKDIPLSKKDIKTHEVFAPQGGGCSARTKFKICSFSGGLRLPGPPQEPSGANIIKR